MHRWRPIFGVGLLVGFMPVARAAQPASSERTTPRTATEAPAARPPAYAPPAYAPAPVDPPPAGAPAAPAGAAPCASCWPGQYCTYQGVCVWVGATDPKSIQRSEALARR